MSYGLDYGKWVAGQINKTKWLCKIKFGTKTVNAVPVEARLVEENALASDFTIQGLTYKIVSESKLMYLKFMLKDTDFMAYQGSFVYELYFDSIYSQGSDVEISDEMIKDIGKLFFVGINDNKQAFEGEKFYSIISNVLLDFLPDSEAQAVSMSIEG